MVGTMAIDIPEVVDEVRKAFMLYRLAVDTNDVAAHLLSSAVGGTIDGASRCDGG